MSYSEKNPDWNVLRMLEWATEYFREKGIPSPRLSIEWLLAHVLEVKRLDLYMAYDRPLSRMELDKIRPLVLRRAEHEPLQYITGSTDFYNFTLSVTKDVLIPRPETEELVERILKTQPAEKSLSVLDIGTGSGCIALALKKACPNWNVTAIDNSREAMEVARRNARTLELDVTFHHSPFESYQPDCPWDIIVSNPPYIHKSEIPGLAEQVTSYEPQNALIAGDVHLMYQNLMDFCTVHLKPEGYFYFEINESEGSNILKIYNIESFKSELVKDYSGKDRFVFGYRIS